MDGLREQAIAKTACGGQIKESTFGDRLEMDRQRTAQRLADIERAQAILAKNPDLREFTNILARNGMNHY